MVWTYLQCLASPVELLALFYVVLCLNPTALLGGMDLWQDDGHNACGPMIVWDGV